MSEQSRSKYEEITESSRESVEKALRENIPETLLRVVMAVSMHDADWRYAQDLCVRLSSHPHFNVRGNAVLGFGHIARVHRQLDQTLVQPIIQAALCDESDYIRGQAVCAMDDTAFFLKWHYDQKTMANKSLHPPRVGSGSSTVADGAFRSVWLCSGVSHQAPAL